MAAIFGLYKGALLFKDELAQLRLKMNNGLPVK